LSEILPVALARQPLIPIGRKSLVDSVTEQLTARILRGDMQPGDALPSEHELADALGVSRPAVREALNRLAAARLVSIRHSGGKVVLDYRTSAGLELLPALLISPQGAVDEDVVRSVLEMRSALAPDVARLAALRAGPPVVAALRRTVTAMAAAHADLVRLQLLAGEFWEHLVDGSRNVAYRLAYNSLRASYDQSRALFTRVLADENSDVPSYAAITTAVQHRKAARAESMARKLVRRGEKAITALLRTLQHR
jgi:GntR family transcriptional repressor for pyruvate dehydrogenase complex